MQGYYPFILCNHKYIFKALNTFFLNQLLTMGDGILHEHTILSVNGTTVWVISLERYLGFFFCLFVFC